MAERFQAADDPSKWVVAIVLALLLFAAAVVVLVVVKRVGGYTDPTAEDRPRTQPAAASPPVPLLPPPPQLAAPPAPGRESHTAEGPGSRESRGIRSLTGVDVIAVD